MVLLNSAQITHPRLQQQLDMHGVALTRRVNFRIGMV